MTDCDCPDGRPFADLTPEDAGRRVCFPDAVSRCDRSGRLFVTRRKAPKPSPVHLRRWDFGQAFPMSTAPCSPQDDAVFWSLAVPTRLPQTFGPDAEDALSLQFLYSETPIRFCEGAA